MLIILNHQQDKWITICVRSFLFVRLGGMAYFEFKHIVFVEGWGLGAGWIECYEILYMITITFFLDSSNPCCNDYILHLKL